MSGKSTQAPLPDVVAPECTALLNMSLLRLEGIVFRAAIEEAMVIVRFSCSVVVTSDCVVADPELYYGITGCALDSAAG